MQRLRHAADAVLTGIGTVLADDPRLTDRTGLPRRRPLLRVVVDSSLRISPRSKLVRIGAQETSSFSRLQPPDSPKARALEKAGVEVLHCVRARQGGRTCASVLRELGRRQILSAILEAGADLNGAALEAGIVDKMLLFYAPRIMGARGVPLAQLSSQWFAKSPALSNLTLQAIRA